MNEIESTLNIPSEFEAFIKQELEEWKLEYAAAQTITPTDPGATIWSPEDMQAIFELYFFMGEEVSGTAEQIVVTCDLQKLVDKVMDQTRLLNEANKRLRTLLAELSPEEENDDII